MKVFIEDYLFYGFLIVLIVSGFFVLVWSTRHEPTPNQIQAQMDKYSCKPTNNFVGKRGDRLYLCNDGLMYKYEGFRQLALEENRK